MASEPLVREDIDAGKNLIKALDSKGFGVLAALWVYSSDTDRWRFVIAYDGPQSLLERKTLEAATAAADWRASNPEKVVLDLGKVKITSATDALIVGLKPIIRVEGVSEIRLSNNLINGIYLEDALIHRLAA